MKYAQTIAMASDLLSDGRADDVVQMVEPLLEPLPDPSAVGDDPSPVLLHALLACVDVVYRGRPDRALERLASFASLDDRSRLPDAARAEVALWLGWGHAFHSARTDEEARALSLLDEAEQAFSNAHVPAKRMWTHIGQARAYFALDEFDLMRRALVRASVLHEATGDALAERWLHELHIPSLRFQGRYGEAQSRIDALAERGRAWNHRRIQGHALAQQAALQYDLGRTPSLILETARSAQTLLQRLDGELGYPLLAAVHAEIGTLLRQEDTETALRVIDRAEDAFRSYAAGRMHLLTLRVRIALRQHDFNQAGELLDAVRDQVRSLPHGLHRSHVALLHGDLCLQTDRPDDGIDWLRRGYRNARETGHRGNQLRALLALVRAFLQIGDLDAAESALESTTDFSDYFSVLPYSVRRFRTLGDYARARGNEARARAAYTQALTAASLISDAHAVRHLRTRLDDTIPADAAVSDRVEEPGRPYVALASPPQTDWESTIGLSLVHASLSVDLVVETWMQAVEQLYPGRWIGIFQHTGGDWTCIHEHGVRPASLSLPSPDASPLQSDGTAWIPLQARNASAFCMGVVVDDSDADRWLSVQSRIAPWLPAVQLALERALLHRPTAATVPSGSDAPIPVDGFVAQSAAMQQVAQHIRRIQTSHSPVLITGETGTETALVAEAVHTTSERSDGPLVSVRCASLQRDPVEARLFGQRRSDGTLVPGAVQKASGGTLLLQDIDELPLPVQASLLRVIEAEEVVPQDDTAPIPIDVRVLATTSANLRTSVQDDRFHEGLYYQLNVIPLRVPPLRERSEDIPLLARHFLDAQRPPSMPNPVITNRALDALLRYDWPGNVRQLRNEMERVLVFVGSEPTPTVDLDVLSGAVVDALQDSARRPANASAPNTAALLPAHDRILDPDSSLRDILEDTEKALIERALRACDGQVTATAEVLGLTRQGLYKKMKRLDVDASAFQPDAAVAS